MVFEYKKNDNGHYVCGVCGEIKEKQNTMHYHLQKHEGTMSYGCTQCDKKFYQKYALENHVKMTHLPATEPPIKCPFDDCKDSFHKKDHCRVHIARNHLRELISPWIEKKADSKIHTCGRCKKDCNSYASILYHVMDHAKDTTDPVLKARLTLI
jgi:KRAB domain-containing zinc finger protein